MNIEQCEKIFIEAMNSLSMSEFYFSIEPLFNQYPILSIELVPTTTFWRARKIETSPYTKLSEIDYPPPEITKTGRLNDEGVPVFYISDDIETALAEVDPIEGELVQIAGFKVKKETPIIVAVIGEYSHIQKRGYMEFTGNDPDKSISKFLNQLPVNKAMEKIYIDRFFAHILRDKKASQNQYQNSRSLAQAIFTKNHAHGIAFPSVKDNGGFNLAIKPSPSDKSFLNVSCVTVKVNAKRKFDLIDYKITNSATRLDENNCFVWPESYVDGTITMYNLSKEQAESEKEKRSSTN